ncbi:MAG TPA: UbiX family flavin prenyltransferase [Candidatus Limiplasma sp.]|nr:UbiX family flavin prenyltransferase [Candidatus Limiplasma sp.]HRX07566.1 UbiX family flavin prenyltransferase [Candidatus Limiplasma sp.]
MQKLLLGLTGASGSIYFVRLCEALLPSGLELHLIATENGKNVLRYETGLDFDTHVSGWQAENRKVFMYDNADLFAPPASGSARFDAMAVVPCSMSAIGMMAGGISQTLLTRSADVMLKERRRLILVPRETPFSTIHLQNMTALSQAGAVILPAMPAFYGKPETKQDLIDFVVGKVLDSLGIDNLLFHRWKGEQT